MPIEIDDKKSQSIAVVSPESQTFELLQNAVASGTSPEALEKLVDLQERILARNAESEFSRALAEFQQRCPVIEKRKEVRDKHGRLLYRFAPLEHIVAQIRDLLASLGLSFSFDSPEQGDSAIVVECTIRHISGHKEVSQVKIPQTKGINTNASQDRGIQLAYGRRQALCNALGITTADEDVDGHAQRLQTITEKQAADLAALVDEVGADLTRFLRFMRAGSLEDIPVQDYERAVAALEEKRRS